MKYLAIDNDGKVQAELSGYRKPYSGLIVIGYKGEVKRKYEEKKTINTEIISGEEIKKEDIKLLFCGYEPLDETLIVKTEVLEAQEYLKETDWVETYKTRHELNLEIIDKNSSKWEIINKRENYKRILKKEWGG